MDNHIFLNLALDFFVKMLDFITHTAYLPFYEIRDKKIAKEKFSRLIKEMNIYLQLKVNNAINLDDSNFKLLSLDLIYSDGNCLLYKIFNI